jgi:queuine/archaeosine tRNA-ribosyltransferase
MHNVHYQLNLMRLAREAILEDRYPQFVRDFFNKLYHGEKIKYPQWAVAALRGVGLDLLSD